MEFDVSSLKLNKDGLIPAIAQDHETGEVLMLAWMNADSIRMTLESRRVTYWSRSRQEFWVKGETSGNIQELKDFRLDCDRDAILVLVQQKGPACHTNRRTCFYTAIRSQQEIELMSPQA